MKFQRHFGGLWGTSLIPFLFSHYNTRTSDTHPDPLQGDTDKLFARHKGLWLPGDVGNP